MAVSSVSSARRPVPKHGAKQRIMEAAGDLFFAEGFSGVTMDALAARLGMSKKTLYAHFKKKDDLLNAVIEWRLMAVRGAMQEIVSSPADFMDKFYAMCSLVSDLLSRMGPRLREDLRVRRPDLWRKVEEYRRVNILSFFSALIDEGVRLGILRDDLDRDLAILTYLSAVQGVINPETLSRHPFTADEAFRGIVSIVFEGILTDAAKPHYRKRFKTTARRGR